MTVNSTRRCLARPSRARAPSRGGRVRRRRARSPRGRPRAASPQTGPPCPMPALRTSASIGRPCPRPASPRARTPISVVRSARTASAPPYPRPTARRRRSSASASSAVSTTSNPFSVNCRAPAQPDPARRPGHHGQGPPAAPFCIPDLPRLVVAVRRYRPTPPGAATDADGRRPARRTAPPVGWLSGRANGRHSRTGCPCPGGAVTADPEDPDLERLVARTSGVMMGDQTVATVLRLLTATAVHAVPAAWGAGITLGGPDGTPETDRGDRRPRRGAGPAAVRARRGAVPDGVGAAPDGPGRRPAVRPRAGRAGRRARPPPASARRSARRWSRATSRSARSSSTRAGRVRSRRPTRRRSRCSRHRPASS